MPLDAVTLEGTFVRLEPLTLAHEDPLLAAAADGELWNLAVTIVPSSAAIGDYLASAFRAQTAGHELPFAIRNRATDRIIGTTRYRNIELAHRRIERHVFETWQCLRVQFTAHAANEKSRAAIRGIGAMEEAIR